MGKLNNGPQQNGWTGNSGDNSQWRQLRFARLAVSTCQVASRESGIVYITENAKR